LEVKTIEFKDGDQRATFDEQYLAAKKSEFIMLIEKCFNGNLDYLPHLNKVEPQILLGEKFIEIILFYSLESGRQNGDLTIDFLVKALEMQPNGSALPTKTIYDTFTRKS
jgi:hypothetical protein